MPVKSSQMAINALGDRILIVGGGVAGSYLALRLAQAGCAVDVVERQKDPRINDMPKGSTIAMTLSARGLRPLEAAGIREGLTMQLPQLRGRCVHAPGGSVEFSEYGREPGDALFPVYRHDLVAYLVAQAAQTGRVKYHFEHECVAVDWDRSIATIVGPIQREERPFSVLFGTDGRASRIRTQFVPPARQDVESGQSGFAEFMVSPELGRQLPTDRLHIWPRQEYLIIVIPLRDGSLCGNFYFPAGKEALLSSADDLAALFQRDFADVLLLVPDLVAQIRRYPMAKLATIRVSPWHFRHQCVLLGDAAHRILPFYGLAANLALEEANHLMSLLTTSTAPLEHVFAEFESTRKPDADALANLAQENERELFHGVLDTRYLRKRALETRICAESDLCAPRYQLVVFSQLPLAQAAARVALQNRLLDALLDKYDDNDAIGTAEIRELVAKELEQVMPPHQP